MIIFVYSFFNIFLIITLLLGFAKSAYAATTPFRSAKAVTTDALSPYTNLENCSATDGKTCDRTLATGYGNLYFRGFGNYTDFGMPDGSTITHMRIRVAGKSTASIYSDFGGCEWPSDLWILYGIRGDTVTSQTFITPVSPIRFVYGTVWAGCLSQSAFDNNTIITRLNYSSGQPWSANIDNFELAFDYEPPPPSVLKTPLLIIPGIGGSDLKINEDTKWASVDGHGSVYVHTYPAGEKIWVNEIEAAKPGDDDYFDVLRMMPDGVTSQTNIGLTGEIYAGAYKSTIDFFVANGYTVDKDLFVFPYDWRKDIAATLPLLDEKIEAVKKQTGKPQVDILGHSMGGVLARSYISDIERAGKIKRLFTLGSPHLGSVIMLKSITYGGCLTSLTSLSKIVCLGMHPAETKDVLQNMIGAFQLLPSQAYFNFYSNNYNLNPFPFRDDRDIDNNNVTGSLNYEQIKSLLNNLGHNTNFFIPAETFHNLDDNLINTNGVETINIVGSGRSTLGQIIETYSLDLFGIKIPKTDQLSINGDGTVPLFSASLTDPARNISLLGKAKAFYTKQDHMGLVSSGPALQLVKNILDDNSELPSGVSATPYNFSGTTLSVHSPVNIHVYDADGNHTGLIDNGDVEQNIPGSSYDALGDAKFIFLPENGVYTAKFEAIDNGSFDFKIRKYVENENIETFLYKDIPLTSNTRADTIFNTSATEAPVIHVDENGDGNVDFQEKYFSIVEGNANSDFIPPVLSLNITPTYIWPPNDKMINITIAGTVTDDNPYLTTITVDDEYHEIEPSVTIQNQTSINKVIQLKALRRGDDMDGRIYTIRIVSNDIAGNSSLSTVSVTVPHDQSGGK